MNISNVNCTINPETFWFQKSMKSFSLGPGVNFSASNKYFAMENFEKWRKQGDLFHRIPGMIGQYKVAEFDCSLCSNSFANTQRVLTFSRRVQWTHLLMLILLLFFFFFPTQTQPHKRHVYFLNMKLQWDSSMSVNVCELGQMFYILACASINTVYSVRCVVCIPIYEKISTNVM